MQCYGNGCSAEPNRACSKCGQFFCPQHGSPGLPACCSECASAKTPDPDRENDLGTFFLVVGQFLSLLACLVTVGTLIVGLNMAGVVATDPPVGAPGPQTPGVHVLFLIVGTAFSFCFWMAMFIVFTRVKRMWIE